MTGVGGGKYKAPSVPLGARWPCPTSAPHHLLTAMGARQAWQLTPNNLLKSLRHSRRPPSSLRRCAKRHAKGLIEKNSLSITIGCLTLIEKPNALVDFAAPRSTSR
jgi:hypothetical protein